MKKLIFITCIGFCLILNSACSSDEVKEEKQTKENIIPQPKEDIIKKKEEEEDYSKGGSFEIESQELKRKFIIRVPKSYDGTQEVPLVISLHGATENGSSSEKQSGFTSLGNKENFIVTYPTGLVFGTRTKPAWTFFQSISRGKEYNDVVFINDLIKKISTELKIDKKRVYLVGHSNGAFFSYAFGTLSTQSVAAIGVINGLGYSIFDRDKVKPSSHLPVIHIHGQKDDIVPPNNVREGSINLIAEESVLYWVGKNKASVEPVEIKDDEIVNIREWKSSSDNNGDVRYVKVKNGTHLWFRDSNSKFDATEAIWEFFKEHQREGEKEL